MDTTKGAFNINRTVISYSVIYAGISSWSLEIAEYRCSTPGSEWTFALIAGAMNVVNHQVTIFVQIVGCTM